MGRTHILWHLAGMGLVVDMTVGSAGAGARACSWVGRMCLADQRFRGAGWEKFRGYGELCQNLLRHHREIRGCSYAV